MSRTVVRVLLLSSFVTLSACGGTGTSTTSPSTEGQPLWRALPKAPITGRIGEGAVWTGSEMIVWGGVTRSALSDGAAYNPFTNVWRSIAPPPADVLGEVVASAWMGTMAVFWAGNSPAGPAYGATYSPATDTWRRLPKGPLGPREGGASVWTGKELLIITGGAGDSYAKPVAAALDPLTGRWRLLPAFNRMPGLTTQGAIWNGTEVFLAGLLYTCPEKDSRCTDSKPIFLAYNPLTDLIREISLASTPMDAEGLSRLVTIAWTGSAIVMSQGNASEGLVFYDPARDEWTKGAAAPCVTEGFFSTAWLGDRWVVPCGANGLQIYESHANAWRTLTPGPSPLNSLIGAAVAWTGTDLIVWSGTTPSRDDQTPNEGAVIRLTST